MAILDMLVKYTASEGVKELQKEASKLSVIKQDTKTDQELLALIIFGCKVLKSLGLYYGRRCWLNKEICLLRELQEDRGPKGRRKDFLNAVKTSHRMWIIQLISWARLIRDNL
jgi:restriction endonuclease